LTYHFLKIAPKWLRQIVSGGKTFEIRRTDRRFMIYDRLVLMEWQDCHYTGRYSIVKVMDVVTYEDFPDGLREGYCVLGIVRDPIGPEFMRDVFIPTAETQGINTDLLEVQL